MNIKTIAVPMFVALSLVFGACATDQTIETPDAVDGAVQEGIEGVEQGAGDAGNAIKDGATNLKDGAGGAAGSVQDGVKDLQKGAGDAAGVVKDGAADLQKGAEDAGNTIKGLGDKIPGKKGE